MNFIETAFGLLHLQMSVLQLLYRTHFGADKSQLCGLARWFEVLERNSNKLWDKGSGEVKSFNSALDFFEVVLDGCILAVLCNVCGYESVDDFGKNLGACNLQMAINIIAQALIKFKVVHENREQQKQDTAHDNLILFLQHALMLRNFSEGLKCGDPGRVFASMSYFTVWFQASKQHLYAAELLRHTACLRKIWSERFVQFYRETCLINLSGKRFGYLPFDAVNEYLVREMKAMRVKNTNAATDHHWRYVLALNAMMFPEVKEKMAEECEFFISDYHSTHVETSKDVRLIATYLLRDGICSDKKGRDLSDELPKQFEVTDLYIEGQKVIAATEVFQDLKNYTVFAGCMDGETEQGEELIQELPDCPKRRWEEDEESLEDEEGVKKRRRREY